MNLFVFHYVSLITNQILNDMFSDDIYSDKKAMNYEYLIRRIYNCGRSYDKGADADIYILYPQSKKMN